MVSIEHRLSLSGFEYAATADLAVIDNDSVVARSSLLPWRNLSKVISNQEINLIKNAPEAKYDAKNGLPFVQASIACLKKWTDEDITQFVLVLLQEFLQNNTNAAPLFLSMQSSDFDFHSLLLRILARSDYHPFTIEKSCMILALLISLKPVDYANDDKVVPMFGSWLSAKASDTNDRCHAVALESLKLFLKEPNAQQHFADEGGLSSLVRTLQFESTRNTQIVYQAGFCIWLLSFNSQIHSFFLRDSVIPVLVDTVRFVSRDKVARIIVACIRNLIGYLCFNEMLVQLNFISTLDILEQRTTAADPEMIADITFIRSELQKAVKLYTSFEVFLNELQIGQLKWGPIHTEAFWKENAMKCEADGFAPIRRLIELLESKNNSTVAICCFDIGEFSRIYPAGKQIVRKLGGQERLMMKMSHSDQEVQQQALLCVQKLMVNNWAVLQRGKN